MLTQDAQPRPVERANCSFFGNGGNDSSRSQNFIQVHGSEHVKGGSRRKDGPNMFPGTVRIGSAQSQA